MSEPQRTASVTAEMVQAAYDVIMRASGHHDGFQLGNEWIPPEQARGVVEEAVNAALSQSPARQAAVPAQPVAWRVVDDGEVRFYSADQQHAENYARDIGGVAEPLFATPSTGQSGVEALRRELGRIAVYTVEGDDRIWLNVSGEKIALPESALSSLLIRLGNIVEGVRASLASTAVGSERAAPVAGQEAAAWEVYDEASGCWWRFDDRAKAERAAKERGVLIHPIPAPPASAVAQIVAWLRADAEGRPWPTHDALIRVADAIERGEWQGTPVPKETGDGKP